MQSQLTVSEKKNVQIYKRPHSSTAMQAIYIDEDQHSICIAINSFIALIQLEENSWGKFQLIQINSKWFTVP